MPVHGPVAVGVDKAVEVAVGEFHSCVRQLGGTVLCWGLGSAGQVGDGKGAVKNGPAQVKLAGAAQQIDAGRTFACALLASGKVQCWGYNGYAQLGDGTGGTGKEATTPVDVANLSGVSKIALGWSHACAISAGKLYCWGRGNNYQLGSQTSSYTGKAKEVPGIWSVQHVAAGEAHTCAIAMGGKFYCWGANGKQQSAPGANALLIKQPTEVTVTPQASQVSLGRMHTCIVDDKANAWCWGENNVGQVGDGTTKVSGTPTKVE